MKLLTYTLKDEAIWTMIFAFGPFVLGLVAYLIIQVLKSWI
jgi:hypothetical protein